MPEDEQTKTWTETITFGESIVVPGYVITRKEGRKMEITGDQRNVAIVKSNGRELQYRPRQARDSESRE